VRGIRELTDHQAQVVGDVAHVMGDQGPGDERGEDDRRCPSWHLGRSGGNRHTIEVFADGFAGKAPLANPGDAVARADGVEGGGRFALRLGNPEGRI
jgi:hypothetical protein